MNRSLCLAAVGVVALMCLPASARILVYEPFAYPDGSLTGRGGALGTIGTWVSEESLHPGVGWRVHQEGDSSGIVVDPGPPVQRNMFNGAVANLRTAGGYVGLPGPEDVGEPDLNKDFEIGRYMDASIALDPRVTATFQSGTTTWFSYVAVHAWDRNQETPNLMLCTDPTVLGNRAFSLQNSGNGIGAGGGPPRNNRPDILPRYFREGVSCNLRGAATAWTDDAKEAPDATATMPWVASDPDGFGAANIIVGKIEWDADAGGEDVITVVGFLETDTMSEKAFDALVALKPELSSRNWTANKPNLDQSQFDLLNVAGTKFFVDEIRIGTTFQDVMGGDPAKANDPRPEAEKADVPRDLVLGWTAGSDAGAHDVYLGTVFDDVNDATPADPRGVLVRQGYDTTAYDPGRLAFGTTYYWRVDEVSVPPDSTIYKGDVWSFTTEPVAYAVAGQSIKVTASDSAPDQGPLNTINSSGLANDLHSEVLTAMWLTAPNATGPAWVQYEFNRVLRLHEVWVWNHNGLLEPILGLGAKEVKIEYSTDGSDFKVLGTIHEFARAPGRAGYACDTIVDLQGIAAKYVRFTILSNWGNILKQYGLSEVRFYSVPVFARGPSPTPAKTGVAVTSSLSWRAGREAAKHALYLSTDQQAVINGTAPAQTLATPAYVPALNLASTYYWRVDEVNEAELPSTWQGEVWSFSTEAYAVVDGFDSYTDNMDAGEAIFQTWIDGYEVAANGSLVGYAAAPFAERTIIHSGRQSMPLAYDNATATYSEAKRTFDSPQNWTEHGIKGLTLWFYGDRTNVVQQMYVKINNTKILYDGEAANLKMPIWQMWYISLAGQSVSSVTSISLGFDKLAGAGGTGKVLIDDLRLYPRDRELVTPKAPDTVGLQVQYLFEGNTADSSGKGRNGSLKGAPTFVAGKVGQAISLDGFDDSVNIDGYKGILADAAGVQQAFTVCAWIKTAINARDIIAWGTNVGGQRMNFRVDTVLRVEHGGGNMRGTNGPSLLDNEWHHVAATVPQGGTLPDTRLYLDGADVSAPASATVAYNLKANVDVAIGMGGSIATGRFFQGLIDDVRIYDRALSAEEIAGMGGKTQPFDKSF